MISFEYALGKLGMGMDKFIAFIISLPWYMQVIVVLLIIILIFVIQNRIRMRSW